jgi:DNA repair exonuclease SbcCD ATPase subunit
MSFIERYKALAEQYKLLSGMLEEKKNSLESLQKSFMENEDTISLYTNSLEVLEIANQYYQQHVLDQIDTLVTEALQVICENDAVSIKTDMVMKRGQPEANMLYKDGVSPDYGDLLFTHGGGIVDIISCALRLIIAELMNADGFIAFDEPIRMLHSNESGYEENFIHFIKEFSHKRNRQIIIITHSANLMDIADKSFKTIKGGNGRSYVE